MRNIGANLLGSIFFILLAVIYLIEGRNFSLEAEFGPGPGFFPLVLGISLIFFSFIWLVDIIKRKADFSWKNLIPTTKSVYLLTGCTAFIFLVTSLGTLLALFLLLFLIWYFEKISWWLNLILSTAISLGLYSIFRLGLEVSLPEGILWF